MALALDTSTIDPVNGSTSNTHSHTCSGSDRVLYVFVLMKFVHNAQTVTYNGVAMTELAVADPGNNSVSASVYRLIAPATGANNVVVDFGEARTAENIAVSFTGAHQTTPEGTVVTATGDSTTPSAAVSSAAGEIVVDAVALNDDNTTKTLTAGASQTELQQQQVGTTTSVVAAASTEPGASSVTMSWTASAGDHWAQIAVPVKPAAAGGAFIPRMALLGVG